MRQQKIKLMLILFGSLSLIFTTVAASQQAKGRILKHTTTLKDVSGEVVYLRNNTISLLYNRDVEKGVEYEMLFTFNPKQIKLDHIQSLAELARGDIARVEYEEEVTQYEGKPEEIIQKAKRIAFVKKGKPQPAPVSAEDEPRIFISQ